MKKEDFSMKKIIILSVVLLSTMMMYAEEVMVGYQAKRDTTLQSIAVAAGDNYRFCPGDTVVISKDMERYLSGERPSIWVHYVRHIVQKIGSKRFPDGVLIGGIMSWTRPTDLLLLRSVKNNDNEADARSKADHEKIREAAEEVGNMSQEDKEYIQHNADRYGTQVLESIPEPIVEEPAPAPVVEEPAPAPVVEEPAPAPVVEEPAPAPIVEEQVVVEEPVVEQVVMAEDTIVEEQKPVKNHYSRFTIGARGGVASLRQQSDMPTTWKLGYDAFLDLQYAHYWKSKKEHSVGFLFGASAGYINSAMTAPSINDKYSVATTDGTINYTIQANDLVENDGEIVVEVPVMFSLVTKKGFFLNLGPRLQVPVFTHYNQSLTNPHITAYFPTENVTVKDELITGKVLESSVISKGKFQAATLNVLVSAELGYEFKLKSGNSFGLGVYADYCPYSMYSKNTGAAQSAIRITPPSATMQPAKVDFISGADAYGTGFKMFDAGLKLAYHFNFIK